MEKMTFQELENLDGWEKAVIVFKQESFNKEYNEISRSYEINSNAKYFNSNMNGTSLFGNCLDGKDDGVRLDIYMNEKDGWQVEYCYVID